MLAATIEVAILSISAHRAITGCPACVDSSLITFSASSPVWCVSAARARFVLYLAPPSAWLCLASSMSTGQQNERKVTTTVLRCTHREEASYTLRRSPLGQYQLRQAIAANRPCSDGTTGNAIQLHGPKLALDSANMFLP
jgi:hypothetical protein